MLSDTEAVLSKRNKQKSNRSPLSSPVKNSIEQRGTAPQMRDAIGHRSRLLARRFVKDDSLLRSLRTLHRLETEDLRRENAFYDENPGLRQYRCEDGSVAEKGWDFYRNPALRQSRMRPPLRYVFRDSKRALVCIRRKARRSVIFALRRAGKAGARNRPARWTEHSRIVCKR